MHKIITAAVIIALASAAMGGAVYAKPGNGGIAKMPQGGSGGGGSQMLPGGAKGGKGAVYDGGDIASPGDAFELDFDAVRCDGPSIYKFDDAGVLQLICIE